jgi:hypothetical protein
MATNNPLKNKSFGGDKCVDQLILRAGYFEYIHVPSMKKLFTIEEKDNSLHCCDFSLTG